MDEAPCYIRRGLGREGEGSGGRSTRELSTQVGEPQIGEGGRGRVHHLATAAAAAATFPGSHARKPRQMEERRVREKKLTYHVFFKFAYCSAFYPHRISIQKRKTIIIQTHPDQQPTDKRIHLSGRNPYLPPVRADTREET